MFEYYSIFLILRIFFMFQIKVCGHGLKFRVKFYIFRNSIRVNIFVVSTDFGLNLGYLNIFSYFHVFWIQLEQEIRILFEQTFQ